MIKRIFAILFCIMLTGCAHREESTIISFSTWGSASELSILKPIISDFERENPKIKVELRHLPQDYFKKIHLLFASNLEPDVIFINNLNLPVYSSRLADLSEITDRSVYYKQGLEALSVGGKIYALPRDISVLVVYYNKDLFRRHGLKFPNKNWTISDLKNYSDRLTTKTTWGIGYEPDVYYALPYIRYFKSDLYDSDYIEQSETENFKKGIKYYKDLAYRYHVAPIPSQVGSKTLAQMFLEKKIAMHLSGRWLVPKYRECANFNWDVINFPDCSAPVDASGWAISKNSKHKPEAIKFILYLSKKENIEKMSKDGLIIPARKDVAESEGFLGGIPDNSQAFIYAIKNSFVSKTDSKYNKNIDLVREKYFE